MICDNILAVNARISGACLRSGRVSSDVILVGVTKYSDVPAINEAVSSGLFHIAENRVQDARDKFPHLGRKTVRHLIGHLQSNKVKDAVGLFDLIQSVDSRKLVDEIQKRAAAAGKVQDILVQLDIAREEQKFGLPVEELDGLIQHVQACEHIRMLGLMAMAPLTEDKAVVREVFRQGRTIFDRLAAALPSQGRVRMQYLSMGMSQDFELAIEQGANMVRIGSLIFK